MKDKHIVFNGTNQRKFKLWKTNSNLIFLARTCLELYERNQINYATIVPMFRGLGHQIRISEEESIEKEKSWHNLNITKHFKFWWTDNKGILEKQKTKNTKFWVPVLVILIYAINMTRYLQYYNILHNMSEEGVETKY